MNETAQVQPVAPAQDVTGPRIGAAVIDLILMSLLFVVMGAAFGDSSSGDDGVSINLSGLPFIVYVLLVFGYYFLLEWKLGQTLGKKLVGIKVVTADGSVLTPGKSALRTVLRVIDGLPFFYLVGLICILASKQKQRIGDMAAGTLVVKA
jgi:uncharacterized RDD family membrane protein YckC